MSTQHRKRPADARRLVSYALAVAEAPVDTADDLPETAFWAGPIGVEDELTGDGRLIQNGALRWEMSRDEPAPLRIVRQDVGAHDGAEVAGSIFSAERRSGGIIWAEGDFDMSSDAGRAAYVAVRDKRQSGVSMDLDDVSFEVRVAGELLEGLEDAPDVEQETDEDGRVTVVRINSDDEVMVTTDARVRAATLVAVPAFADARIGIVEGEEGEEPVSLVASTAPVAPPASWFEDPHLTEPTALTVTKDGRVFGHLATWGSCHISHSAGGKCVTPPNSPSGYSWFHTGALETAEGDLISVGHLTMNTGHAKDDLSPTATLAHYDDTGTAAADVRVGEDSHGIWVAGGLRSTLTPEQVREFRAAPLSGDWRRVGNALELVAALSVNVPGFGVPRPSGHVRDDNLISLVASGIIVPVSQSTVDGLSNADLTFLRSFIDRENRAELASLVARRNRVKVAAFARRRKKG